MRFRSTRLFNTLAIVTGALATLWSTGTLAATQSTTPAKPKRAIEEVVVTAQRTSQDIQQVPIAVTALSGNALKDRQVITPSDLQMNAPNLSFTSTNFGGSSFSIRGIGNLLVGAGDPGVSTHINQIPIESNMNAVEFFDMKRVEILRGPQGTLFGKNATGGVINFVTNMPSYDGFGGNLDVEAGKYKDLKFKGAINIPLSNNFAIRIAGMKLKRDGYITNTAYGQKSVTDGSTLPNIGKNLDGRDLYAIRTTASWQINDNLSAWVQYSKFNEDDDRARITNQVCKLHLLPTTGCEPNGFGFDSPNLGTTTGGIIGGLYIGALPFGVNGTEPSVQYDYPNNGPKGFRYQHTDFQPVFKDKEDIYSMGVDYNIGAYTIGFLGAYQKTSYVSQQDYLMDVGPTLQPTAFNPTGYWPTSAPAGQYAGADWTNSTCNLNNGTTGVEGGCIYPNADHRVFAYDQSDSDGRYFTMELKIQSHLDGPFNFLFGVNKYHQRTFGDYYVLANTLDMLTTWVGLYPGYFDNTTTPFAKSASYGVAAFGEVYYDLTPNLKLTIGARMNKDDKDAHDTSVLYNAVDIGGGFGNRLWSRVAAFVGGSDTDPTSLALANLYAPNLLAAALGTPAGSPERLAVNAAVPIVPQPGETRTLTGSPTHGEWKKPSGRIGLNWQVNDQSMMYAFLSRGYKPGGFNPAIPPAFQGSSKFTFEPESINAFEVGSKNMFLDGSLMLNGDVFFYDYKGLQVTRIKNNSSINDNINARIYGLELESEWHPDAVPALAINFSYSYLHARVKGSMSVDPVNRTGNNPDWVLLENIDSGSNTGINYIAYKPDLTQAVINAGVTAGAIFPIPGTTYPPDPNTGIAYPTYVSRTFLGLSGVQTSDGVPVSLDGNKLPNSPDNSFHLGLSYTWDVSAMKGNVTARWDYYWQSSMYAREFNTVGDHIDSWDQHNASVTYASTDGRWGGSIWIRNIANSNNITGKYLTSDTSGFYRNYFLTEPRIYGATLTYRFGAESQ